jgi:hypothetical protein
MECSGRRVGGVVAADELRDVIPSSSKPEDASPNQGAAILCICGAAQSLERLAGHRVGHRRPSATLNKGPDAGAGPVARGDHEMMLNTPSIDEGAELAISDNATRAAPPKFRSGYEQKEGTQTRIRRATELAPPPGRAPRADAFVHPSATADQRFLWTPFDPIR